MARYRNRKNNYRSKFFLKVMDPLGMRDAQDGRPYYSVAWQGPTSREFVDIYYRHSSRRVEACWRSTNRFAKEISDLHIRFPTAEDLIEKVEDLLICHRFYKELWKRKGYAREAVFLRALEAVILNRVPKSPDLSVIGMIKRKRLDVRDLHRRAQKAEGALHQANIKLQVERIVNDCYAQDGSWKSPGLMQHFRNFVETTCRSSHPWMVAKIRAAPAAPGGYHVDWYARNDEQLRQLMHRKLMGDFYFFYCRGGMDTPTLIRTPDQHEQLAARLKQIGHRMDITLYRPAGGEMGYLTLLGE